MEKERKPLYVVYNGGERAHVDVMEGYTREAYADELRAETDIKGVYDSCDEKGRPVGPLWERTDDGSIVIYVKNDGAFSYGHDDEPVKFAEAYRDFVARFEAGKLAPLRLDGDETEGMALFAFPAMNGIYSLKIEGGKIVRVSLF